MVYIGLKVLYAFQDSPIHCYCKLSGYLLSLLFILLLLVTSSLAAANSPDAEGTSLGVNNAPVLGLIGDRSVSENGLLTFKLSATDSDNDIISYFSSNLPEGSSLDYTSGVFEWVPGYDQSGVHHVEFIADDGEYNDSEYIAITVLNTNRPPVFSIIPDSEVDENSPLELTLEASDLDGDILEFTKDVSFGAIYGNKFSWTPSYDDSGDYMIKFVVNDGSSEVVRTAKISVRNLNRPPILYYFSDVVTDVNEPVTIQLAGFDPDGDDIVYLYSDDSSLKNMTFFDSARGFFEWTPTDMDPIVNPIGFIASDGMSNSSERNAQIVVKSSYSVPIFNPISAQQVNESSTLSFKVSAVDEDKKDELKYSMGIYPDGATLGSAGGFFEWTPSYEQAGTHTVEFLVEDDSMYRLRNVSIAMITVADVNRGPNIELAKKSYVLKAKETIIVIFSVSDPDGDPVSISTNSSFGTIRGNAFIWTPDYNNSDKSYDIQFSASDGDLSANTSATIYVEETNMPPELNSIGSKTVYENNTLEFTVNAADGDKDTLSLSASGLPSGATFNNSNGQFRWTPTVSQAGMYTVSFKVTDGELNDYETISITVKEPSESSSDTGSTSSSGGSGGGGGGATGEAYENIQFKDYILKPVLKDVETVFSFSKEENSIISVSFTTGLNGGQTKAVVEMLKGTSTLVSKAPSGTIYKNMNIWVGDGKFLPELISDATVVFKVEKSWTESKGVDPDSIKLIRYSGSAWKQLPTSRTGESDEYFYYVAETPGFSPFAISSVKEEVTTVETSGENAESTSNDKDVKNSVNDEATSGNNVAIQDEKSTGTAVMILILLGVVFIGLFGYNNREYCEECYEKARLRLGNPDGKRYRRFKR